MEVLDGLCNRMKLYQARAGPEFPYIKGGTYIDHKILESSINKQCFFRKKNTQNYIIRASVLDDLVLQVELMF